MKYGYSTQALFSRAFSQFHGFTSGIILESNIKVQSYLPISFQLSISGDININ